jgi:hypothetical protein
LCCSGAFPTSAHIWASFFYFLFGDAGVVAAVKGLDALFSPTTAVEKDE